MYPNLFKTGQAEPLRERRILPPPILRRLVGGIAAGLPTASRRDARRVTGVIPAAYPPERPAKLPGNLRAIAGRLLNRCRTFFRQTSGKFPPQYHRTSVGVTGAVAGQSPITFPSYARH